MSTDRETTRIVRSWLEEGVTALPDRVLDAVLDQLPATPQHRPFLSVRRSFEMNPALKYVLAAAAVLVVAIGGYQILPGLVGPGDSQPTPSVSPAASIPVWDGPGALARGTWAMDVGPVRAFFDIPIVGWQENIVPDVIWQSGSDGRFGFHVVDNLYASPCDDSAFRDPPVGPSVDDLATALSTLPGIPALGPTEVTFGGHAGKRVEISLPADDEPCGPESSAVLWEVASIREAEPLESGAVTRFWIVDVDGTRVVVFAVVRDALQPVYRNQMQEILDSIRLESR